MVSWTEGEAIGVEEETMRRGREELCVLWLWQTSGLSLGYWEGRLVACQSEGFLCLRGPQHLC